MTMRFECCSRCRGLLFAIWLASVCMGIASPEVSRETLFRDATEAYRAADYALAAREFRLSAVPAPASGTLRNLGNAEWRQGHPGTAVLAWEQAQWINPFDHAVRDNLRFARKTAQLDAPDLAWYEVVSSWLPANWWAWIASCGFWLAMGMGVLPGVFRWRKAVWHQAVAALGLMVFLLSVPAHLGVQTRLRIAYILEKDAALRLTPTADSEVLARLPSGSPVRIERVRGDFVLVRTGLEGGRGWMKGEQVGRLAELRSK